jgi:hypothetical protein
MKISKRIISAVLSALLIFCALPVTSLAASSEIWPGYPGVDQLPAINTIPDPFKFFNAKNDPTGDGYVSNPTEWTTRRDEIKELVQHYWLGYRWPTRPQDVQGETKDVMEPNAFTYIFWNVNLKDEFDKLVAKLQKGTVEIHDLTVVNGYGATTEGNLKYTFGPAADRQQPQLWLLMPGIRAIISPLTSAGPTIVSY